MSKRAKKRRYYTFGDAEQGATSVAQAIQKVCAPRYYITHNFFDGRKIAYRPESFYTSRTDAEAELARHQKMLPDYDPQLHLIRPACAVAVNAGISERRVASDIVFLRDEQAIPPVNKRGRPGVPPFVLEDDGDDNERWYSATR
jgi:hypothetical protein